MKEKKTIRAKWTAVDAWHESNANPAFPAIMHLQIRQISSVQWQASVCKNDIGIFGSPESAQLAAESAAIDLCRRVIESLEDAAEGAEEKR